MSYYGIQTSAWLRISGECDISYETCGGEAEFSLGGRDNDVHIVASEAGLRRLVDVATSALHDLRVPAVDG